MAAKVVESDISVSLDDLLDSVPRESALTEDEAGFLTAVRDLNADEVRYYLSERNVYVNCMDACGETALQTAVTGESSTIIRLLLNSGADIGTALLQAVARESVESVKILLEYGLTTSLQRVNSQSPQFNRYATPLMLAAHNDSYELVKLLLFKKHDICEDSLHDRLHECKECDDLGRIGTALLRLDTYRALASPSFLSLSYLTDKSAPSPEKDPLKTKDPMIRAFLLNRKLEELSESEYEFKPLYKELSNQCEEYAVSLLNQCRSMEEIKCLMHVPGLDKLDRVEVRGTPSASKKKLSVLNFAIANKNEKFVAHPYSQLLLNSELYQELKQWENCNVFMKIVFGFLFSLLLPFWAICYLLFPKSTLGKTLATPLIKFVSHTGAFCWFLFLLVLSSVRDKFTTSLEITPLDVILTIWISGLFFQEIKEAFRQGKDRYLSQYWNIVSLLTLILFLLAGIFWIVGYALTVKESRGNWTVPVRQAFSKESQEKGYRFLLLSNGFFSVAFVGSFIQGSNLFQVNSVLGPLQLSIVNMMRDIVKFLFLFSLVFLSFAFAERKVYSTYVMVAKSAGSEVLGRNNTEHSFARIAGTMRFLFWDLFGMADLDKLELEDNFKWTQYSGEFILALYNIAAILISLNMLIAMMAITFQRVADDADIQWKFSRTRMWMQYVDDGNVLPPPFNLIPTPQCLAHLFGRLFSRRCGIHCGGECCANLDGADKRDSNNDQEALELQRPVIIKRLIQRYCFKIKKSQGREVRDIQRSGEGISDTKELKSLVQQLMGTVETCAPSRPSRPNGVPTSRPERPNNTSTGITL